MKIGIISDTHDDLSNVDKAISIFNREKVSQVVHAGDFVFPGVVERFRKLESAKLVGVLGNNDGEKLGLDKMFQKIGGELKKSDLAEIQDNDNKDLRIAVYHGTDEKLREAAIQSEIYDIFIHGHTHIKRLAQKGKTLILNPGTAHYNFPTFPAGWKGWIEDQPIEDQPTVIVYDTLRKESKFFSLSSSEQIPTDKLRIQTK
jgi:putative phosphoesterase